MNECLLPLTALDDCLCVFEYGPVTVIGFDSPELPEGYSLSECRAGLQEILSEIHCQVLVFDLAGIDSAPHGFLGLLLSMFAAGVSVELLNCSDEVRQLLQATHVDELLFAPPLRLGSFTVIVPPSRTFAGVLR